jgi:hypothetical protein
MAPLISYKDGLNLERKVVDKICMELPTAMRLDNYYNPVYLPSCNLV